MVDPLFTALACLAREELSDGLAHPEMVHMLSVNGIYSMISAMEISPDGVEMVYIYALGEWHIYDLGMDIPRLLRDCKYALYELHI